MSSIRAYVGTVPQRFALEYARPQRDHEVQPIPTISSEDRVSTQPAVAPGARSARDFMPLHGIDHIELWVGNAQQAAYYYAHAYGFREVAYAGLETGVRDRTSRVLVQGRIRLVLSGALTPDHEIARHQARHGDGVRVIALSVPDAAYAYRTALERGATGVREPWEDSDDQGTVRMATIAAYGDTLHTFVERAGYRGAFLPGYEARAGGTRDAGLLAVDHIVGNVELGAMEEWVTYYEDVFGMTEMTHFTDDDISTEYSALMSKVVTSGNGRIKFPINEPAEGKRKSQIDEYLEFYGGPGAQHIAVATRDIVKTVEELSARGVEFLRTPESYYDEVPARVGEIDEDLADLRRLGILVDRDDEGYLLQIFTKPVGDRPTVFFEVIERHGARGFGDGNFKALFEAIEREQERRGNL
jgi:4-hydroxyphenylpyruvate dioxygenase